MLLEEFLAEWNSDSPTVLVHTSGSTGTPKPMLVEKRRMAASARMTCQFLGLKTGDKALLCLPLDYIAGKMMVVRAQVWGLRLVSVSPSSHPLATLPSDGVAVDFAAMVPMQVYHSLQVPAEREWLQSIRHLIVGGGAIDPALEQQLEDFPHHVWSTYGMTETLSHIALRPLNGPERSTWYSPFSGISVSLSAEGCLQIDAPQLTSAPLLTHDLAELHPDGRRFRILGRSDNVIITGGVKLQTEQMEQALRAHMPVPFMITRRPDPRLGQSVVLLVEGTDIGSYRAVCERCLSRYEQPRQIVSVGRLPLTPNGKPSRAEAERMAREAAE